MNLQTDLAKRGSAFIVSRLLLNVCVRLNEGVEELGRVQSSN